MTENEAINGWTFEETIQTTENLMEVENNVFKWDVLRHLRDFAESFKDELEQYRAIGTIEEFKALKEKSVAKKPIIKKDAYGVIDAYYCPDCGCYTRSTMTRKEIILEENLYCGGCGKKLDWQ